jgi:hypothetical protein
MKAKTALAMTAAALVAGGVGDHFGERMLSPEHAPQIANTPSPLPRSFYELACLPEYMITIRE